MLKCRKNKQRGIGLLELMLSLAIIAILLVMATRYFLYANENQKINNAISMIHGIAGGAAHYFIANHGYANMDVGTLVSGKYIPTSFAGSNNNGQGANPWGGDLTTKVASPGYTITLSGVPAESCTKVANMLKGEGNTAECASGAVTITLL